MGDMKPYINAPDKTEPSDPRVAVEELGCSLGQVRHWKRVDKLRLNHDKPEVLVVGPCCGLGNDYALVTSRLEYCSALYGELLLKTVGKLPHMQNAAAQMPRRTSKNAHLTFISQELHWLPISFHA